MGGYEETKANSVSEDTIQAFFLIFSTETAIVVETETAFASVNIISAFLHETLFIPDKEILSSHDNLSDPSTLQSF